MSDVTARYASDWCTATRRFRLSESWWQETLQPYAATKEERELEEEDIMSEWLQVLTDRISLCTWNCGDHRCCAVHADILYSHPLPTSVNDYKSHPLYVLRRHLLKFEGMHSRVPMPECLWGWSLSENIINSRKLACADKHVQPEKKLRIARHKVKA